MLKLWHAYVRLAQIGWDANAVVAMRMMRLASGGALAQREVQRMVAEKGIAIAEAQAAAAAKIIMGAGIVGAAKSASALANWPNPDKVKELQARIVDLAKQASPPLFLLELVRLGLSHAPEFPDLGGALD